MSEGPRVFVVLLLIIALGLFGLFAGRRTELGVQPSIGVDDQPIVNGTVTVHRVQAGGPGWVVIYNDSINQVGEVIGFTPVPSGQTFNVIVPIDVQRATPVLYAVLHRDLGVAGTFEYPGADLRVFVAENLVIDAFLVLSGAVVTPPGGGELPTAVPPTPLPTVLPAVNVTNQPIINETVVVARVVVLQQGWVTIHNDNNGQPDMILGAQPVQPGETLNIVIPINVNDITPWLHAALFNDLGTPGAFEIPGADIPVTVNGVQVSAAFQITGGVPEVLPPSGGSASVWHPGSVE